MKRRIVNRPPSISIFWKYIIHFRYVAYKLKIWTVTGNIIKGYQCYIKSNGATKKYFNKPAVHCIDVTVMQRQKLLFYIHLQNVFTMVPDHLKLKIHTLKSGKSRIVRKPGDYLYSSARELLWNEEINWNKFY